MQCAEVVEDQMQVIDDRPDGRSIQILQCRWCGETRACRPGWQTRCHICLDERSAIDHIDKDALDELAKDSTILAVLSELTDGGAVTDVAVLMACSILDVLDSLYLRERPGWTIEATDLCGLPWHPTDTGRSHGTWARHDACGTVSLLKSGRTECAVCPPPDDARSHRARADVPHLLYVVKHGSVQKFGHGNDGRVRTHVNGGAEVGQVLRARHEDVVAAEREIVRQFSGALRPNRRRLGVRSFGRGTEVLPRSIDLELSRFLRGEDVTRLFATAVSTPENCGITDQPYSEFTGVVAKPSAGRAGRASILLSIIAIVEEEGPMVGARIHRVLSQAVGWARVTAGRQREIDTTLSSLVRRGLLVQDAPLGERRIVDRTYRLPDQPAVKVRTLGPRDFGHVPPRELAVVLARTSAHNLHPHGPTDAARRTAAHYGLSRVGRQIRDRLDAVRPLLDVDTGE